MVELNLLTIALISRSQYIRSNVLSTVLLQLENFLNDIYRKKYITNENNNIIQVHSILYMSNEGCFTFIIHHFV